MTLAPWILGALVGSLLYAWALLIWLCFRLAKAKEHLALALCTAEILKLEARVRNGY